MTTTPVAVNWSGNVRFAARAVHRPTSVEHLQELVARSDRVKALGTGHSFSAVADTDGDLISTAELPRTVEIDTAASTVRVGAGVRFAELAPRLDAAGLALPNLGSLPHISVAGACATGTHGSGARNGVIAAGVRGVELVRADGSLVTVDDPAELAWAAVSLGAVGVVTATQLALVPRFEIQQFVYEGLRPAAMLAGIDEIMDAGHSVSVFTDWGERSEIWLKRIAADDPPRDDWLGARPAHEQRPAGPGVDPAHGTPQLGVPGPWFERLPHFRSQFTPSRGDELQSEYYVARADASAALEAVFALRERIAPLLQISELRAVAADELWLSGASGCDVLAVHFTWSPDEPAVREVVRDIEARLRPFGARPHWGKVFETPADELATVYPWLADFARRRAELDPDRVFANAFLDAHLPG